MENNTDKSYLILPLLAYTKHEDGTKEITIGWLTNTITFKWK